MVRALAVLLAVSAWACAGGEPKAEDAGAPVDCTDEDGDGFGQGADCDGPDCNDANRNVWAEEDCLRTCDEGSHEPGCDCDAAEFPDPEDCYSGPEGTLGVGECAAGSRTCEDGAWSPCRDEVGPAPEVCNYVDDDCDGETDEAAESLCGCGLTAGVECPEPFAIGAGNAEGVILEVDGSLVLGRGETEGVYRHRFFEPCTAKANNPAWQTLAWEAETPAATSIAFEARTEDCADDPGSDPWVAAGEAPADAPPVQLRPAFADAGEPMPVTCLGVQVTLRGAAASPRLVSIAANLTCR